MENRIVYAFLLRLISLLTLIITVHLYADCGNLLSKKYNEITWAATHNGHSHGDSPVQNQTLTLTQQFEQGIRATKIHVWYDYDAQGKVVPFVCHGVTKEMLNGSYLDKIVDKVPKLFQSWARDVLQKLEPINELVRDACNAAYGQTDQPGLIQFKHCILDPAKRTLASMLGEVKVFLDKNSDQLITLILEDHTNNLDRVAQDFKTAGLDGYVHTQDITKQWPTLGAMVQADKRLVVLFHGDEKLAYEKYPWMHYLWAFAWDTEWSFQEVCHLKDPKKDVMPKRGKQAFDDHKNGNLNKLFMVHHYVTPLTGGCLSSAKKVNKKGFLQTRIDRLIKQSGKKPNIIQIDFFDQKDDVLSFVEALNA